MEPFFTDHIRPHRPVPGDPNRLLGRTIMHQIRLDPIPFRCFATA